MSLQVGIIGLPNVGKSTLFNALTVTGNAQAGNYPFCTIEPNSGIVGVDDERLVELAKIAGSSKIIPAYIEFVDIAGLVKGASKGEGLGNKFLSHIRQVDAIVHVLRCFEDANVTHIYGKVDPIYDAQIVEEELIIADLELIEKRLSQLEKRLKSGDKTLKEQLEILKGLRESLSTGIPARRVVDNYDKQIVNQLQLLTAKPILYVSNVIEQEAARGNHLTELVTKKAQDEQTNNIIVSSKIEAEVAKLEDANDKAEFIDSLELAETGLNKIVKASYGLLNLQSFFTVGPKEAHAWNFTIGTTAPKAAGIIHSDFEKGFIRAEIISFVDYLGCGGEAKAKEAGKMRLEGREYKVQDGDVVHFRFNV